MGFKILYGRAGSGKSYTVYDEIKNLVDNKEKVFLCVPEQFTHMTERKIMEKIGSISPFSCQVISFERIIRRVYEETGEGVSSVISDTVRSVLMSRAIQKSKLSLYSNMSSNEGFLTLMEEMIDRFKKHSISPEDIIKTKEEISNQMTKEKLSDISLIYSKYQEILKEKYTDSADLLTGIKDKIAKSGLFDDAYVYFDEYSSFIPPEIDVIFEICKVAKEVVVTLCTDTINLNEENRYSVFAPSVITSSKLFDNAKKNGIKAEKSVYLPENKRHNSSSALAVIEKNLYSSYVSHKYDESNVEIHSYFDIISEVKHTASEIVSLCRDKNMRFRDIAVICSDLGQYSKIISDVFNKYNIKTFIDEKTPLSDIQPAQFVLGALKIYIESYSYESVFSYLRLGFCDISDSMTDVLEEYVLAMNINKSDWVNDDKWEYKLDKFSKREDLSEKYTKEINASRKAFLDKITEFHNSIKGRHTAKDMCDAMYRYMLSSGFEKKIKEEIKEYENTSMTDEAKILTLVWNKIITILEEISEALGETLISPSDFYMYLKVAFSSNKIGLIPTSSDSVTVGNADRTRIKNVKVLFVLGTTENAFPKKISTFGLFTGKEKDILSMQNIEFIKSSMDEIYYNRFLIYSVLTVPEEKLYISYPCAAASGESSREAMVVTMIKRNLGIEAKYITDEDDNFITNTTEAAWEYLMTGIRFEPDRWKEIFSYLSELNPEKANAFKKALFSSNIPVCISDETLGKYFKDTMYTTVSRLGQFAMCKFSYFMRYMLNLEPRQEISIDFANIGTLSHGVFEKMCKDIENEFSSFAEVTDEYIRKSVDRYIEEFARSMSIDTERLSKRELFKIERLKDTLYTSFKYLVKQIADSRFSPLGYEIRFDDNGLGCVEIELSNGKKVKLTGVIDRADCYKTENGTFVRVIDYKTGSKEFSLDNIFYGLDFQLFVYLDALTKSNSEYRPAGALYFKINDFVFKGDRYSDNNKVFDKMNTNYSLSGLISSEEELVDAFDEVTQKVNSKNSADEGRFLILFNHLEKKAAELADGIMAGQYSIDPYLKGSKTPCAYCNYSSICKNKGNYRLLDNMRSEAVWSRLEEENNVD